jgi:hypothetical protein
MLCYLKGFFRYKLFNSFKPINKISCDCFVCEVHDEKKKNQLKGSVFFFFFLFQLYFLSFFLLFQEGSVLSKNKR